MFLERAHGGLVPVEQSELASTSETTRWGDLDELEKRLKMYEQGEIAQLEWLDRLMFARVAEMRAARRAENHARGLLEIALELPTFLAPVVFRERQADRERHPSSAAPRWDQLIWLVDGEVNLGLENPAERKHQKLTRSVARGVVDHDLKPNSNEKKSLAAAIRLPPTRQLGAEHKALLWKFRFSLRTESDALTKFLKCVDWGDGEEAKASIELMYQWSPIDPAAALELLSPTFTNDEVRRYAVSVLSDAGDDELMGYLQQLVQALRYERQDDSQLARFLVDRAVTNSVLANFLHWYLVVEWRDPTFALGRRTRISCSRRRADRREGKGGALGHASATERADGAADGDHARARGSAGAAEEGGASEGDALRRRVVRRVGVLREPAAAAH